MIFEPNFAKNTLEGGGPLKHILAKSEAARGHVLGAGGRLKFQATWSCFFAHTALLQVGCLVLVWFLLLLSRFGSFVLFFLFVSFFEWGGAGPGDFVGDAPGDENNRANAVAQIWLFVFNFPSRNAETAFLPHRCCLSPIAKEAWNG